MTYRHATLFFLTLFLPVALSAQDAEQPDRWQGALDLGFSGSTGNTRLAVLNAGFSLKHLQTEAMELEWAAGYRYGESDGRVVQRNANTSLALDLHPRARWSPFAFATLERDPFRRLDLRSNTGTGIKYTLFRDAAGSGSLSMAALYSAESFTADQAARRDARWSARLKLERELRRAVRIEAVAFFKPVWDHASDYDIDVRSKLSSRITERLALTFVHEYLHDSTPPAGVAREDQRFQAGATIEFF